MDVGNMEQRFLSVLFSTIGFLSRKWNKHRNKTFGRHTVGIACHFVESLRGAGEEEWSPHEHFFLNSSLRSKLCIWRMFPFSPPPYPPVFSDFKYSRGLHILPDYCFFFFFFFFGQSSCPIIIVVLVIIIVFFFFFFFFFFLKDVKMQLLTNSSFSSSFLTGKHARIS